METKDARIFITSVGNVTARLENYGDANTDQVQLLKLIYKYACYSPTYACLQRLDSMVAELQRTSPFICLEKQAVNGYVDTEITIPEVVIGTDGNEAPILTAGAVTLEDPNYDYTFSYADMFSGWTDDASSVAGNFVIKTLPGQGTLKYNGTPVTVGVLYADPTLLVYSRDVDTAYPTLFTYSAYDTDAQLPLESNTVDMEIAVEAITTGNEPATVGDRAQYAGNRVTTVFSVADFTTETILPYFDPEANDLDAIRIDEVSTANVGTYYYLGVEVVEGQVITAAELAAGAFYHVAADANGIVTDSFNASVRDTGSLIWVQ
jgi:hypothetical protein